MNEGIKRELVCQMIDALMGKPLPELEDMKRSEKDYLRKSHLIMDQTDTQTAHQKTLKEKWPNGFRRKPDLEEAAKLLGEHNDLLLEEDNVWLAILNQAAERFSHKSLDGWGHYFSAVPTVDDETALNAFQFLIDKGANLKAEILIHPLFGRYDGSTASIDQQIRDTSNSFFLKAVNKLIDSALSTQTKPSWNVETISLLGKNWKDALLSALQNRISKANNVDAIGMLKKVLQPENPLYKVFNTQRRYFSMFHSTFGETSSLKALKCKLTTLQANSRRDERANGTKIRK